MKLKEKTSWLTSRLQRLTALLLAALLTLYAGWLTCVIAADRPLDFYVYYMAAETFARGGNAYTISDAEWDALAADLHHELHSLLPLPSLHGGCADPCFDHSGCAVRWWLG